MEIYDISVINGKEVPNPDNDRFSLEMIEMEIGDSTFVDTRISLRAHTGTHLDAPSHLLPFTKDLCDYPLDRFLLPAVVIDIKDPVKIGVEELKAADIREGDAVVFKTLNSVNGWCVDPHYQMRPDLTLSAGNYVYLSMEAAESLVEKGVTMLGLDFGMGESWGEPPHTELHKYIFAKDVIFLESIYTANVPAGRYTLSALPLKMEGATGLPVRAVLFR